MRRIVLIAMLAMVSVSWGQNYKTAIGIKGGWPYYGSLDLKHNFGNAYGEFRVGGYAYDLWLQGLFEKNYPIDGGLEWYWGVGGHVGFWNYGPGAGHWYKDHYYDDGAYLGLDGVIGLEYTFDAAPINIAIDAGPSFNGYPYSWLRWGSAIAVRFAIK